MSVRKSNRIKLSKWDYAFHVVNYTVFLLFTLVCVYPFYYIIINSLSEGTMVDLGKVLWKPIGTTLYNYKKMLALADIYTAARVSVIRTVVGTAASGASRPLYLTIDAGVPVLSMHAPFEVVAKIDCYMTYKGILAAYKDD